MVRSVTPLCQSQMRMVLSSDAETRSSPSGVKARSAIRRGMAAGVEVEMEIRGVLGAGEPRP